MFIPSLDTIKKPMGPKNDRFAYGPMAAMKVSAAATCLHPSPLPGTGGVSVAVTFAHTALACVLLTLPRFIVAVALRGNA